MRHSCGTGSIRGILFDDDDECPYPQHPIQSRVAFGAYCSVTIMSVPTLSILFSHG